MMAELNRRSLGDLEDDFSDIVVGNFRLEQRMGTGAMGEVWKGHHVDQQIEVALKVIVSDQAHKTRFQRAFRQEVRSMAQLNHPFVVDVFDYGTIDERAEEISIGQLRAGSPYLVMEFAEHGSLVPLIDEQMSWGPVQLVLFSLLDALAHSHGRGVLHRDIKPHNVLVTEAVGTPMVKLTDFGLAYALQDIQEVTDWHRAAGTPEYMAPELITGKWRQYGPHTDLYALGCLAYELLSGHPPFAGDNVVQIAKAHLEAPIPSLDCRADVPPMVQRWIEILLAKDPTQRFRSAADAAHALRHCTESLCETRVRRYWNDLLSSLNVDSELSSSESVHSVMPTHSLHSVVESSSGEDDSSDADWSGRSEIERGIPDQWKRSSTFVAPPRLTGTGCGIFGLRRLPLLGRDREQQVLWERFRQCSRQRQVGVTVLSGPAGVGKDYLAKWLCDRAGELGAAQVLRAYHDSAEQRGDELSRMLEREFHLTGLTRPEVERALQSLLTGLGADDRYEWEAITELLCPGMGADHRPTVRFASPKQRHMALVQFFQRLSRRGPVILWLNDIHWGLETLNFVQTLVRQADPELPMYVVMTVRDDLLTDTELHGPMVDEILAYEKAEELAIEPLDDTTMRHIVEEALYLEPSAAYEVARRSGGNPLHALELVGEWIEKDWLQIDNYGYALSEDAKPEAPGDWMGIWSGVVDRLAERTSDGRRALELGAILGERIHRPVWENAAQLVGAYVSEELVDTLLARKYLYITPQGLVFAQNMLREALHLSAREHRRWEKMCRVCAQALRDSKQRWGASDEKIGLLFIEADEVEIGARYLLRAIEKHYEGREYHAMIYLAERGANALKDRQQKEIKELRCQLLIKLSHGWHGIGKNGRARRWADEAVEMADLLDDPVLAGVARLRQMAPTHVRGELEAAHHMGTEGLALLQDHEGTETRRADICLLLAHIEVRRGACDEALRRIEQARQLLEGVDAPVVQCNADFVSIKVRALRGDDVSSEEAERVVQQCRRAKTLLGEAQSSNARAEIARRNGELDDAMKWYERAIELHSRIDPDRTLVPRLNRALIAIKKGNWSTGGLIAERALHQLRRTPRAQLRLYALAAMVPMRITRGEFALLEEVIDEVEQLFEQMSVKSDADIALCLKSALQLLEEGDDKSALRQRITRLCDVVSD